jgi:Lectin C-type domain
MPHTDLKKDWDSSVKYCADHKMNLATFDSKQEAEFFLTITTGRVWVGMRDNDKNGKFKRITDGKDVTGILPWSTGEPSGKEYCVERYDLKNKLYNDVTCNIAIPFSCEFVEVEKNCNCS